MSRPAPTPEELVAELEERGPGRDTALRGATKYETIVIKALLRRGYTVLRRGWPDLLVVDRHPQPGTGRPWRGQAFAVEIKANGDQPSEDQRLMHALLRALGVPVYLASPDDLDALARCRGRGLMTRTEAVDYTRRLREEIAIAQAQVERLSALYAQVENAMTLLLPDDLLSNGGPDA